MPFRSIWKSCQPIDIFEDDFQDIRRHRSGSAAAQLESVRFASPAATLGSADSAHAFRDESKRDANATLDRIITIVQHASSPPAMLLSSSAAAAPALPSQPKLGRQVGRDSAGPGSSSSASSANRASSHGATAGASMYHPLAPVDEPLQGTEGPPSSTLGGRSGRGEGQLQGQGQGRGTGGGISNGAGGRGVGQGKGAKGKHQDEDEGEDEDEDEEGEGAFAGPGPGTGTGHGAAPSGAAPPVVAKGRPMPENVRRVLLGWFLAHSSHPFPSSVEKRQLMATTGLTAIQIRNWLVNQRKRHWRPTMLGREPRCKFDAALAQMAGIQGGGGAGGGGGGGVPEGGRK